MLLYMLQQYENDVIPEIIAMSFNLHITKYIRIIELKA